MPNIAAMLKGEIARVARKEVRAPIQDLKKTAATHRGEIAALKRRIQSLEGELRALLRARARAAPAEPEGAAVRSLRFSAKGFASQRKRLHLSAHDFGLLLGTSGQTVYNWERGQARPQARHLAAIATVRRMGKREAAAQLAALRAAAPADAQPA